MSEAAERLRKWATTGDGRDIDDVALVVLAELDMAMAELNRLKAFIADHRERSFSLHAIFQPGIKTSSIAVPISFMKDPEPTP